MLIDLVTKELINVNVKCSNWQEAIKEGTVLLEKKGYVNSSYNDAIVDNFREFGPYMVIAPGIVLSHARPENGVNETGVSIITLKDPIKFGSELNDPVKLIITLAAKDNTKHLDFLAKLMSLFTDAEDLDRLMNANEVDDVLKIVKKYI